MPRSTQSLSSQVQSTQSQSQQRQIKLWSAADTERLIAWMEDNQEALRGLQSKWYKDVKDALWKEDADMTWQRVRDKVQNMKQAWKRAANMRDQSGWGLSAEDHESSVVEKLEKTCQHFYQLDNIWGSRVNITPLITVNATELRTVIQENIVDENKSEKQTDSEDEEERDTQLPWEETPTPSASAEAMPTQSHSSSKQPSRSATPKATPEPSRGVKRGNSGLKDMMNEARNLRTEIHTKKLKQELSLQERQIESQERIASIQADSAKEIAKLNAESQERQMKIQAEAQAESQVRQAQAQQKQFEALTNLVSLFAGKRSELGGNSQ